MAPIIKTEKIRTSLRLLNATAQRDQRGAHTKPVRVLAEMMMPVSSAESPIKRKNRVKKGRSEAFAAERKM